MIRHVAERVEQVAGLGRMVIAVPYADVAEIQAVCARRWHVVGFRDVHEADVLGRFYAVHELYPDHDVVMRVTADCPLWNPRIAEQVVALCHADPHVEYASNVAPGYVDGEDVEVFSASALAWANRAATDPYDREHVCSWLRRNVKTATLQPANPVNGLKTSIDTPEDLERVRLRFAEVA